ncbi:MAG: hypothetical protein IJ094_01135 [Bacilli bacterium]|nr:hypothetical protein [Bacilli bacterium]
MKNIYIYKITNKKDGNIYIGIRRTNEDVDKERYKGENTVLRREFRKQGKKMFSTDILAKELTEDMAQWLLNE